MTMIAPCGVVCSHCYVHLRETKPCSGCLGEHASKPQHCLSCSIRHCEQLKATASGYCGDCVEFPCRRLQRMDKNYRDRYGVSLIEHLTIIRDDGLDALAAMIAERWTCRACGGAVNLHTSLCSCCGKMQ